MVKIWKGIYWASGYSTLWQPNPWQEGVGATWREIVTQFRVLHSAPAYKDDLGRIHWLQTGSSGLGSQPRQWAESVGKWFYMGRQKSLKKCVRTKGCPLPTLLLLTFVFFYFSENTRPLPCPDTKMLHMRRGAPLISDILEDHGWVNEKLEVEVLKIESVIFSGKIDVF